MLISHHFTTPFDAVLYLQEQDYELMMHSTTQQVYRHSNGGKAIFYPATARIELFTPINRGGNA